MIPDVRPPREVVEYEVVRNGTIDRKLVEAGQLPAPPLTVIRPAASCLREKITAYVQSQPARWLSVEEVVKATGVMEERAADMLNRMSREGVFDRRIDFGQGGVRSRKNQRWKLRA